MSGSFHIIPNISGWVWSLARGFWSISAPQKPLAYRLNKSSAFINKAWLDSISPFRPISDCITKMTYEQYLCISATYRSVLSCLMKINWELIHIIWGKCKVIKLLHQAFNYHFMLCLILDFWFIDIKKSNRNWCTLFLSQKGMNRCIFIYFCYWKRNRFFFSFRVHILQLYVVHVSNWQ
jgi:hypothetical protein